MPTKAPAFKGKDNGIGFDWLSGNDAFIMRSDGKAWLIVDKQTWDGALEEAASPELYGFQTFPVKQAKRSAVRAASLEALNYLDHCLDSGYRPGMGHVVPDRLFWAHGEDEDDPTEVGTEFALPRHETKH